MAAYVQWLAGRLVAEQQNFKARVKELREEMQGGYKHPRTLTIIVQLLVAFETFLRFAEDVGAISEEEAEALWSRLDKALDQLAEKQGHEQVEQDPAERFLSLIRSAILCGEAHLADRAGGPPVERPENWGWVERVVSSERRNDAAEKDREAGTSVEEQAVSAERRDVDADDDAEEDREEGTWVEERSSWWPKGKRVGWIADPYVFLQVEESLAVAQDRARRQGAFLALTTRTLGKTLHARGKLEQADRHRGKYTVRKNIQGHREEVLCLLPHILFPAERPEPYAGEWDYLLEA
jgi:hypothetical protein